MSEPTNPKKKSTKKADLANMTEAAQTVAANKVEELKDFVTNKAQHLSQDAKKYSAQGAKKVADSVKKQPLKAIGIAAAVGAVLGFFFRRKK